MHPIQKTVCSMHATDPMPKTGWSSYKNEYESYFYSDANQDNYLQGLFKEMKWNLHSHHHGQYFRYFLDDPIQISS